MKSNKVECTVVFGHIYDNPTFNQLFHRIPEIVNKTAKIDVPYTFVTNHSHKGWLEDMSPNFKIKELTFKTI